MHAFCGPYGAARISHCSTRGVSRWAPTWAASGEQLQLLFILALGFARQLLDAVEGYLLSDNQGFLRPHRADQPLLHEMELAHGLPRQDRAGIKPRLALEGSPELAQRRVLTHAADEPGGDLIA